MLKDKKSLCGDIILKKYKIPLIRKPTLYEFFMTTKIDKDKHIVLVFKSFMENIKLKFKNLNDLTTIVDNCDGLIVLKAFDTINATEIMVI